MYISSMNPYWWIKCNWNIWIELIIIANRFGEHLIQYETQSTVIWKIRQDLYLSIIFVMIYDVMTIIILYFFPLFLLLLLLLPSYSSIILLLLLLLLSLSSYSSPIFLLLLLLSLSSYSSLIFFLLLLLLSLSSSYPLSFTYSYYTI